MEKLLTLKDLEYRWNRKRSAVRNIINKYQLPAVRLTRTPLYRLRDVERLELQRLEQ